MTDRLLSAKLLWQSTDGRLTSAGRDTSLSLSHTHTYTHTHAQASVNRCWWVSVSFHQHSHHSLLRDTSGYTASHFSPKLSPTALHLSSSSSKPPSMVFFYFLLSLSSSPLHNSAPLLFSKHKYPEWGNVATYRLYPELPRWASSSVEHKHSTTRNSETRIRVCLQV